jgi:hypothetical protein
MELFGFFLSVWAAIGLGVLLLALVVACTLDRRDISAPKWWVLVLGLIVFGIWTWGDLGWAMFTTAAFWKPVGLYLAAGVAYSFFEFFFQVRKESRSWKAQWEHFKANEAPRRGAGGPAEKEERTLEEVFFDDRRRDKKLHSSALVQMTLGNDKKPVPVIDRVALTKGVTVWILFWPAYAISLVLGDVLAEFFERFADLLVKLSTGMVRRMFANSFKA